MVDFTSFYRIAIIGILSWLEGKTTREAWEGKRKKVLWGLSCHGVLPFKRATGMILCGS